MKHQWQRTLLTLCSLTLLIMMVSQVAFADYSVPERIRVGLFYGSSALDQVTIDADHGFSFGQYNGSEYIEFYNLNQYSKLLFDNDQSYHVQVGPTYDDSVVFSELASAMIRQDNEFFAGYDNGWRLYYGNYGSSSDADNAAGDLMATYGFDTYVIPPDSNRILLSQYGQNAFCYIAGGDFVLKDVSNDGRPDVVRIGTNAYRDGITVKLQYGGLLTVINNISMQGYLYGVLPREMSKDWPLEALKAQAVAARNYAMLSMGKHSEYGFDICPTVDCQVYGGYTYEGPISNAAVDATKGMLLYYNSELVQTFYHSNSGGQTENSENIWSSAIPYLKGIDDPYSSNAPNSNWTVVLSKSDVAKSLEAYGHYVGSVKSVEIVERSVNGRVQKLKINGSNGSVVLTKEETRKVFGYSTIKSIWFSFNTSSGVSIMTSRGQSTNENSRLSVFNGKESSTLDVSGLSVYNGKSSGTIENNPPQSGDSFVFYGHGYGHGLGMSQWGAKEMAEQGFSFDQILTHYYSNTYLK